MTLTVGEVRDYAFDALKDEDDPECILPASVVLDLLHGYMIATKADDDAELGE